MICVLKDTHKSGRWFICSQMGLSGMRHNKCWKWLGDYTGPKGKPTFFHRSSIDNVDKIINSYLTRLLCCKTTSEESKVIVHDSHHIPVLCYAPTFCSVFLPMHIFSFHISFCLIYLFFPSPWPSFLPIICSFSHCVDRKCGLCWVWSHQCGVYCPNLRELALKTQSRASEMVEGFTGWRGSKIEPDWVVYLFNVGKRGCQHKIGWPAHWGESLLGLSDWCRAAYVAHDVSLTHFLNGKCNLIRYSWCHCKHFSISMTKFFLLFVFFFKSELV